MIGDHRGSQPALPLGGLRVDRNDHQITVGFAVEVHDESKPVRVLPPEFLT
jgi:hypothetical protein